MAKTGTTQAFGSNGQAFDGGHKARIELRPTATSHETLTVLGATAPPDDQTLEDIVAVIAGFGLVGRLQFLLGQHQSDATATLRRFQGDRK